MSFERENYPDEFIKPYMRSFSTLEKSNVKFLTDEKSFLKKYWRFIYIFPCSMSFFLCMLTYFSKVAAKMDDFIEISNTFAVTFVVLQAVVKSVAVVRRNDDISYIIRQMASLWPRDDQLTGRQTVAKTKHVKRLNVCVTVYYYLNIVGSWQYILVPLFETLLRIFVLNQQSILKFPFGCSFPFDPTETWSRYLMVYAYETYAMIKLVYFLVGTEILLITMTAHLSILFTLLSDDLLILQPTATPMVERDDDITHFEADRQDKGIGDIVRRHQKLIKLSKIFDDIFNKVIFYNVTMSTVSICFFGFVAKIAKNPGDMANNVVGVIASILPIFNLCYYGQLLTDASSSLALSAYLNIWYGKDTKFQKMLGQIMLRSQSPCCITSYKYAPVTLNMFTGVMSTTWSYFSLINSVYEEEKV